MKAKKEKELDVLKAVLAETKRFEAKIKAQIQEIKDGKRIYQSRTRASTKRAAIDLKHELSRITIGSCSGEFIYYTNY